jgi:hypothetical protein
MLTESDSGVSAQQMFLGADRYVYIVDKVRPRSVP